MSAKRYFSPAQLAEMQAAIDRVGVTKAAIETGVHKRTMLRLHDEGKLHYHRRKGRAWNRREYTPELLAAMQAYMTDHGRDATAQQFGIGSTSIMKLIRDGRLKSRKAQIAAGLISRKAPATGTRAKGHVFQKALRMTMPGADPIVEAAANKLRRIHAPVCHEATIRPGAPPDLWRVGHRRDVPEREMLRMAGV